MSGREAQAEVRRKPERTEEKPSRESAGGSPEVGQLARLALPLGSPGGPGSIVRRAVSHPGLGAPALLQLQRQVGNRQVRRMVALAREAEPSEGGITPEVEQSISRSRGGGRPLDSGVRGRMEASFGADFGGVRVHTGGEADRLNRQLSARAFTTGSDVFFRDGEYNPGSSGGRELIAHELTHVVQQQGTVQTSRLTLGPPGDRFEQEAESVARQVMRDEAVSVAPGTGGVARSIQREDDEGLENDPYAEDMNPVIVPAGTFDQAATTFSGALLEKFPENAQAGVVVINGPNVRLYDGYGQPAASTAFRLKRPAGLQQGVYAQLPGELQLHKVYIHPDGKWVPSPATVSGEIDFRRDVEPREPFDNAFKSFKGVVFYIVPGVRPEAAEDELPKQAPESKPEFMKFDTHAKADLPAWPAAVVPLTPQLAPVGTTGKFYCKLDKISWFGSTVDNVFNLLERVNFKWEVLKVDPNLLVTEKEKATRWAATKERFRTKARHIRDDEKTMRGDERASVPEKVYREFLTDQMAAPRRILGYSGEAVLTLMNSLVPGKDPNVEDYIDFTFKEPGDYFVRCLASPITGEGKKRRATSVAGVMISVHKVEDIAAVAIATPEQILENATEKLEKFDEKLAKLRQDREAEKDREKRGEIDLQIGMFEPRRAYLEAVQRAGGDTHGVLLAELELVRAQLKFATGDKAPKFIYTPRQVALRQLIEKLKADEKRLAEQLKRADSKLGDNVTRTGFLKAILLDDVTGARQEVLLSIGEREYIVADRLEVVIADVTSSKGRRFTGMGTGEHRRSDAWTGAMRDLQRNLGRGRGWLSYQAPPPYKDLSQALANPMQLQVAEIDQIKDIVDDAMNAATLAALVAAPFTGGASLGLLAVLVPIQLGSSLYNIVNRAMYDDLELDADAVFSLLDIVSFGVAKAGTLGKAARRSVGMMSMNGRIALGLLDGGGYVLLSYTTYMEIMKDVPGETPQEAKVRKLRALLGLFQASAIPIAGKIYERAGVHPDDIHPARDKDSADTVPADKPAADAPVTEKPAPEPAPAKPAPRSEAVPDVPKEYAAVLQGVAKKVPPMMNPDLEPGTVRIQYLHVDGVITHMRMEIAPGTPAARVKQHVPVARDMARYMGLSGRVRKIYQQIEAWLSKNPAGPGSRAWEAKLEVAKLQRIIDEQFEAYDRAVDENDTALRDALSRELNHLESQLLAHARDVDRFEAGRGFVAAEGAGGTFSPETSRSEAFRELGGFETRAGKGGLEAASDLRSFADTVVREGLAGGTGGIDDIVLQMPDPRGLSPETVRDQIKQPYLAKLAERVTDAKRLRSLASYAAARKAGDSPAEALYRASHAEGTRILDLLPEVDRAAFREAWAARSAAIPGRPRVRDAESQDDLDKAQEEYLSSPDALSPEQAQWVISQTHADLEALAMVSDWTLATNAVGAEVYKSLTPITSEPSHVEGIVVRARRQGKKVTIITGYHGSAGGKTTPHQRFAIDDAKYYNKKYPDVDVIDASEMTHDQRLALIEAIPGVVIVSACFTACSTPSAPAPGQPRGGHAKSIFLPNPEMFNRLSEGINTRPQASFSMIRHHEVLSPDRIREMLASNPAGLPALDPARLGTPPAPVPAPAPATTPAALPEPAKRPGIRDITSPLDTAQEEYLSSPHALSPEEAQWVISSTLAHLEAMAMVSEWTPATNAVGAEVYKSLTPITNEPSHVEGIVVRARRQGKKVTIITGYHGSAEGDTTPYQPFAIGDALYYNEKYPDVDVIDASAMTHDQRLALIDSTSGTVIVSSCYGACAKPSAPARPARTRLALPPGEPVKTPLLLGPGPAPAPAFKTLDQLLTPDKAGFTDKELQDAYADYIARNTRAGDPVATPEEWVALTRGGPRKRLETLLGPGYAFGGTGTGVERLLPLADIGRPAAYTQQRLDADVAAVENDPGKLWERLGRLQNEGVTGGVVGESLFNILKGNAAEILSRKIQDTELAKVQKQHPDARLYDDVRASIVLPDGTRTKMLLFTDNVIASKRGQGLQLHAVFEVKAGSKGGQEATTQVFDWIEGKLDDNTQIQIQVGGDVYVYDPEGKAPNRVIGLARADRHLIAAQGAEHLGLDSGDQIARAPQRHALPQTAEEINFLVRALIEKHIKKNP